MKNNKTNIFTVSNRRQKPEGYPELCQTSKMESFTRKVNGFYPLAIFEKHSILEFWQFLSMPLEAITVRCSTKIAFLQNALPSTVWFRIYGKNS